MGGNRSWGGTHANKLLWQGKDKLGALERICRQGKKSAGPLGIGKKIAVQQTVQ